MQNECVDIVEKFYKAKKSILGETVGEVVTAAMAVSGYNACMGKIIAAPTAGSCGIMPAVLTVCENRGYKKEDIVKSMFTAAGLADIIAQIATFAGAGGGCMAECGSAAAMASSACAEIMGGTPEECAHAFALSLSAVLGLICDPVAGFVEVPCMGKNVMSAVHAIVSAELACAGFNTANMSKIPVNPVLRAYFILKIDNLKKKKPEQLSGGQKQRVAIARALVSEAPYIFGDEISANLDTDTSKFIYEYIRNTIKRRNGIGFFISHDELIENYADTKYIMRDGEVTLNIPSRMLKGIIIFSPL